MGSSCSLIVRSEDPVINNKLLDFRLATTEQDLMFNTLLFTTCEGPPYSINVFDVKVNVEVDQ